MFIKSNGCGYNQRLIWNPITISATCPQSFPCVSHAHVYKAFPLSTGQWHKRFFTAVQNSYLCDWTSWGHDDVIKMETFSAILAFCAGNSPVTGEFPTQRPMTRSSNVFFDLRLNKQLSKQRRRRWIETPSRSLWRHCNVTRTWTRQHSGSWEIIGVVYCLKLC